MAAYTLSEVRTLVLQRADMQNSTFVTTSLELTNYVNESLRELHETVVSLMGHESFIVSTDVQLAGGGAGNADITPDDDIHMKIVRVDTSFSNVRYPLRRHNMYDKVIYETAQSWQVGLDITYTLGGTSDGQLGITVHPVPTTTSTIRVYYVPFRTKITTASEPIPAMLNPWVEYIVIDAAIKCKEKEESDTSSLERAKERFLARLERWTAAIDRNPLLMTDARNDDDEAEYVSWWY